MSLWEYVSIMEKLNPEDEAKGKPPTADEFYDTVARLG
jgi:hypothetical protein